MLLTKKSKVQIFSLSLFIDLYIYSSYNQAIAILLIRKFIFEKETNYHYSTLNKPINTNHILKKYIQMQPFQSQMTEIPLKSKIEVPFWGVFEWRVRKSKPKSLIFISSSENERLKGGEKEKNRRPSKLIIIMEVFWNYLADIFEWIWWIIIGEKKKKGLFLYLHYLMLQLII